MSDDLPPAPTPPAETGTPPTDRSGGVNINAQGGDVIIIGNVVGRDLNVYPPRDKNLDILLQKVKTFWVEGVLENSVHHAALIELGKEVKSDAVEVDHPWETVVRTADQPDLTLPPDQKIVDVFDEMKGALLILGEPGSGKTTMLLELARDLIARVEKDSTLPIPVVFNLSSWAERPQKREKKRQPKSEAQQTIAKWLVDELRAKYGVPSKLGRKWIENNDLILLLDGLDEVKSQHRKACTDAINKFRADSGMTGVVVCSRMREYEELASQLKLNSAILIQPLTREQIDHYFAAGGPQLAALGNAMQTDVVLQELAQAPLMLNVMSMAYSGQSVDSLTSVPDDPAQRRKHLFAAYVDKMFARTARTKNAPYSKTDTLRWLRWLAARMSEHGQTEFLIERMQPSWLPLHVQRWVYSVGPGLFVGLAVGLTVGLVSGQAIGPRFGLFSGLVSGLVGGLVFGLSFGRAGKDIRLAESLNPSRSRLVRGLVRGLRFGLIFGLVSGLRFGLAGVLVGVLVVGPFIGLIVGLFLGLYDWLDVKQIETKTKPNQGIWQSGRNALVGGLFLGLSFGLLVGLVSGLLVGLAGGLRFGGLAFIQHFVLRFILWRKGYIPRNYVRFLDFAAERIFLRKVGGGYIFIHRMLMEYFALLETQPSAESDE